MSNRRLLPIMLAISFFGLWVVSYNCYSAEQQKQEQPVVKEAEQPIVVAKISDYIINKKELEQRVKNEIFPYGYDQSNEQAGIIDVSETLLEMIAEKAMIMEGRKLGYLQDEEISASIDRFKNGRLAGMVWMQYAKSREDELNITQEEIDNQIKANPKLKPTQANKLLQNQKANKLIEKYYGQLCEKFHWKKQSENFSKVVQVHDRLLNQSKNRKQWWILNDQVKDEVTPEEKDIVLATYDGGKITLKDWLYALVQFSSPNRPKDLNTEKGVEAFLDRISKAPVLVAEAKSLGLDKDKDYLKQLRDREDMNLLGKVMTEKVKDVNEPTEEQIVQYFEKNEEKFGTPKTLKIDQIWCENLEIANKVKSELDGGKDFDAVKSEYSLQKQSKPFNCYPGSEGIFFADLWKGEPNQIVGPTKGFYGEGIKWRIVKILEKKPAEIKEYSANMKDGV
ncbi:MAG: hypothetical protein A2Z38_10305, partial [Planctomycetes bacterium RBG_19FT_COMBO_48_8]